jgi:hypothetical protein
MTVRVLGFPGNQHREYVKNTVEKYLENITGHKITNNKVGRYKLSDGEI